MEEAGNVRPKGLKGIKAKSGAAVNEKIKPAKKKVNGKVIVVLFLVALLASVGVSYYFNFFEIKTKVIQFFINQDTQYTTKMADLDAQKEVLAQQQADVESQQKNIDSQTKQLEEREAAVTEKETAKTDAQAQEEAKTADMEKLVGIYQGMESASAAAILANNTDKQWIADLLKQMDEKKAAKILAAMDPVLAASISALMV